jgi:ubiquinone biosynthesis protein
MGSLSKTSRQHFTAIIYSLISHNYENLVYEFLDVAEYESIPDVEALTRDVREALSPYVGLTVQQLNLSELFLVILATLKRHQIYLPREWYLVFRALITLDGVGKSLNIDLNIFGILESEILEIVQKSFSKEDLIEEALWSSRDMSSTLKIFPRHFRWFMRDFAKKGYAIEVIQKGYKKEIASVGNSISFLGHAILTATFILSGILFLNVNGRELQTYNDIPALTWVMWSLGLLTFALGKRKID